MRLGQDDRLTAADARLLSSILEGDAFTGALGNRRAEAHFESAAQALHDFCRAERKCFEPASAVRMRVREAALSLGMTPRHAEALGWNEDGRLEILARGLELLIAENDSGMVGDERTRKLVAQAYEKSRKELVTRLIDDKFLNWLDYNVEQATVNQLQKYGISYDSSRYGSTNPFPAETVALSAFCLQHTPAERTAQPSAAQLQDLAAKFVEAVKSQSGPFTSVIGVSEVREAWDAWAGGDQTGFLSRIFPGKLHPEDRSEGPAFLPSILFVCVGISLMIVLTIFVSQMALSIQTRDWLLSAASSMREANFAFMNLAVGALNVGSCIDPVALRQLLAVSPGSLAPQLAAWPPITSGVSSALEDPSLRPQILDTFAPLAYGGTITEDAQKQLVAAFSDTLIPALAASLANASDPSVLATLPVYGPLLACLVKQAHSQEVQAFLHLSLTAVNAKVNQGKTRVTTSSDPCG